MRKKTLTQYKVKYEFVAIPELHVDIYTSCNNCETRLKYLLNGTKLISFVGVPLNQKVKNGELITYDKIKTHKA